MVEGGEGLHISRVVMVEGGESLHISRVVMVGGEEASPSTSRVWSWLTGGGGQEAGNTERPW